MLKGRNSLVVQWLGLCTFTAESLGSIPGLGTQIACTPEKKRKEKKKKKKQNKRQKHGKLKRYKLPVIKPVCTRNGMYHMINITLMFVR